MRRSHLSLLLATTNRGKLVELKALFSDLPVDFVSLAEVLKDRPVVVETGATLEENALLKARTAAAESMMITLAEDSGLEVDALGGRPGVRSARFAKDGATDAENNEALLAALEEVEDGQRSARFRCVMALVDPWSSEEPRVTEGRCEGAIDREARGTGGFGYDPLFVVQGYGQTMAELNDDDKNTISHRAGAARLMHPVLSTLVAERLASAKVVLGEG